MVERINLLLKAKNITARQFAEEIGIQPSGMSHILSGRNNPSLDFVMKVVKRWPEININWLMFGKGEMYVGLPSSAPTVSQAEEPMPAETPIQEHGATPFPTDTEATNAPEHSPDQVEEAPVVEYDLFSQPSPQQVPPTPRPRPTPQSSNSQPVQPAQPEQPVQPVQPVHPEQPIQPIQPLQPVQPVQPVQPSLPPQPAPSQATRQVLPPVQQPAPVSNTTPAVEIPSVPPVESVERPSNNPMATEPSQPVGSPAPQRQPHENRPDDFVGHVGLPQPNLVKKKIAKVIILYEDHSFVEYNPE